MINFKTTETVHRLIGDLVVAFAANRDGIDRLTLAMDITACHLNGCPLDLEAMHDAVFPAHTEYADSVWHDIAGIHAHIDRDTGRLDHGFSPRFGLKTPPGGK